MVKGMTVTRLFKLTQTPNTRHDPQNSLQPYPKIEHDPSSRRNDLWMYKSHRQDKIKIVKGDLIQQKTKQIKKTTRKPKLQKHRWKARARKGGHY
jgi:hypothetical protein